MSNINDKSVKAKEFYKEYLKWLDDNPIDDVYHYKNAFNDMYRTNLVLMFKPFVYIEDSKLEVIGEHYSKSIKHPAIKLSFYDVEIYFRYNFYDWEILINSKKPIEFKNYLKIKNTLRKQSFYYQGLEEAITIVPTDIYENNRCAFKAKCNHYLEFNQFLTELLIAAKNNVRIVDSIYYKLQCKSCVSKDICPYHQQYKEILQRYSFIDTISCRYYNTR